MPRKPLTEEEKTVVRRRACNAARRLVEEKGVGGLTIRAVAAEIEMSAMSLYTYFDSKADLLSYLQADALSELAEGQEAALKGEGKPEEKLRRLAEAYTAFAEDRLNDFRLAFTPDEDEGLMPARAKTQFVRAMEPLRAVVAEMIKKSRKKQDPDDLTVTIWSAWHGHALLAAAGAIDHHRADSDQIASVCGDVAVFPLTAAE